MNLATLIGYDLGRQWLADCAACLCADQLESVEKLAAPHLGLQSGGAL